MQAATKVCLASKLATRLAHRAVVDTARTNQILSSMENEPTKKPRNKLVNWLKSQVEDINQFPDTCGEIIDQAHFGTKHILLYEKGYVLVRGLLSDRDRTLKPERIIGIASDSSLLSKKTGIGRGLAAVATGGVNMMLFNSFRGEMSITIVTENNSHSISWQVDSEAEVRDLNRLVTTANVLIEKNRSDASANETGGSDASLSAEIEKLHELLKSGALSEKEFQKAKQRILDEG